VSSGLRVVRLCVLSGLYNVDLASLGRYLRTLAPVLSLLPYYCSRLTICSPLQQDDHHAARVVALFVQNHDHTKPGVSMTGFSHVCLVLSDRSDPTYRVLLAIAALQRILCAAPHGRSRLCWRRSITSRLRQSMNPAKAVIYTVVVTLAAEPGLFHSCLRRELELRAQAIPVLY
jgi:hypothetical protein